MNKRISISKSKNYHPEGIETLTIIMAIATIAIILVSIFWSN